MKPLLHVWSLVDRIISYATHGSTETKSKVAVRVLGMERSVPPRPLWVQLPRHLSPGLQSQQRSLDWFFTALEKAQDGQIILCSFTGEGKAMWRNASRVGNSRVTVVSLWSRVYSYIMIFVLIIVLLTCFTHPSMWSILTQTLLCGTWLDRSFLKGSVNPRNIRNLCS